MDTFTDYTSLEFKSRIQASELLLKLYSGKKNEVLHLFYVDKEMRVIGHRAYHGTYSNVAIDVREVCTHRPYADKCGVFISHNHPNGSPYPSDDDCKFIEKLKNVSKSFNMQVLDSFIVTDKTVYSMSTGKVYVNKAHQ